MNTSVLGPRLITSRLLCGLFLGLCIGCGGTSEPKAESNVAEAIDVTPAAFQGASPEQFLSSIFARYRNASSYHDEGSVQLTYRVQGRQEIKTAPMRIWLDRDRLYVEAYDVRLASDPKACLAWISDEATSDFDSQVLRLPSSQGRPQLKALFADRILTERISAGLAGPPPQLEWLFASDPMKQLFRSDHQFAFAASRNIDGRPCRSVQVKAGSEKYQFWIDQRDGVIRRVELPPIVAPPEPGQAPQTMSLSLELAAASFGAPQREPDLKPLPANPQYVRQLIPLPPEAPPRTLGSVVSPFQLRTHEFAVSERGADREATMLVRFAGDPASMMSLAALERWTQEIPKSLAQRLRIVVAIDPNAKARFPNGLRIPSAVDQDSQTSRALQLQSGGLALLDRKGRVVWTQEAVTPTTMVTLGAVVADVLDQVDVPQRIQAQWAEQVRAYRDTVQKVLVSP
ncbi:MAG: hypothetical protein AB8B91_07120 [Rubripirellula sp.]